jgi:hypothetical protein
VTYVADNTPQKDFLTIFIDTKGMSHDLALPLPENNIIDQLILAPPLAWLKMYRFY